VSADWALLVIRSGRLGHTLPTMWRMYRLRRVLREYELLEVGLAMLDGSYWTDPYWADTHSPEPYRDGPSVICGGD